MSIFEHGGHLGNVTWIIYINFRSPFPSRVHMKFGFDWFQRRRSLKMWTDNDDGRRTPDHGYTISSPCEPEGSGELKTQKVSKCHWNSSEKQQKKFLKTSVSVCCKKFNAFLHVTFFHRLPVGCIQIPLPHFPGCLKLELPSVWRYIWQISHHALQVSIQDMTWTKILKSLKNISKDFQICLPW